METPIVKPRRGRPPGPSRDYTDARDTLLRSGMELLTEQGFTATGLDTMLKRVNVPKGSFYHYFANKETFGREVIDAYDAYFCAKLDRWLHDDSRAPLTRLRDFVDDAKAGMARHAYTRGCLVGNLGQELGALPADYRERLARVLQGWQDRVADCLRAAQHHGELSKRADCGTLAAFFWIGWEGAVLRARLTASAAPLDIFFEGFLAGLPR
ncbi:acrylate utilization transcriptional regulator AcuR [Paraburkholderia caballeronis]|uniref:Transcriptional regulator, TetR family n=1 Tax=Paraburkholderia caballeronis TaxID=416943 RepID=A0A1H7G2K7_9BURK|nr:TetR/AcrR family transcriptional regulator [Paraburkholderia caballeronis]PXW24824.1 TetR family transcriptional regulator [Paraburkholderia caballeronis]PXX00554.1 TetR family transcriptional regulator [Paraburkholderia caballeronis]RAJ98617.1 TetR family transcriptional regulator [Paraburkholderia caballeronis]SEE68250.1 transcriptional regulator, TetR family [Paraburkholderia caballeronis]SEK29915.1 transcriptional regulator, TetR family [Paraburkholderia caballeronis]